MPKIEILNPGALAAPPATFSHVARASGAEHVFIAGQVAKDKAGNIVGADDFEAQCRQVYANLEAALASVGAGWENVVQFTSYLVRASDIAAFAKWRAQAYPAMFPKGAPPNTLLVISALAEPAFRLEVQATAVL